MAEDTVHLRLVTLKTFFLTLLASGARRGEVHTLSSAVSHEPQWKYVSLKPLFGFISKTQPRTSGATAFEGVRIRALSSILGKDFPLDRKLCPVRALKVYLARTQHLRQGKKRLFISYQEGRDTDVSKNTISA